MIDWNRIIELRNDVFGDDFGEVAEVFIEEMRETLDRLNTEETHETLEADFHFLKSSALNFGFSELADICSAAEKAASGGDCPPINVVRVIAAFEASLAEFNSRAAEFGVAA